MKIELKTLQRRTLKLLVLAFFFTWVSACSSPEHRAEGTRSKLDQRAMVVTANPHATRAGADVLRAGGSAVDAAIAIQAVLSLVEPQSSGLAGGAFMVHYDSQSKSLKIYDGRETAPANATTDMFLTKSGERMGYLNAKHSGLSTGVPGVVSMLQMAHQDYGKLPWGMHFNSAKTLANDGFAVSERLHGMIVRFGKYIPKTTEEGQTKAYRYFHTQDEQPLPVGHILKNPEYAKTLETIALDPSEFYVGSIAKEIVAAVKLAPRAGSMQLNDLVNYRASRRTALCSTYKGKQLCGPPPPSSWVGVAMMMGILEKGPAAPSADSEDPRNWALFGEAQRLAYADRDQYIADPESVIVPIAGMLNQNYLALRASELSADKAVASVKHGDPWAFDNMLPANIGLDATEDVAGTSHFVVVDKQGNVVSMTASVESIFGSTRMVGGMFLNNQLTDFSFFAKDENGKPIANAVAPGKRPRSSMSPTIVLDQDGDFLMATGSPGGNSILAYTAKTLLGVLDWGLSPQDAVALPNLVARGDKVRIESERASPELIKGLRDYGFQVKESAGENSGLSVVVRNADGQLEGGADPRREGVIEIVD